MPKEIIKKETAEDKRRAAQDARRDIEDTLDVSSKSLDELFSNKYKN